MKSQEESISTPLTGELTDRERGFFQGFADLLTRYSARFYKAENDVVFVIDGEYFHVNISYVDSQKGPRHLKILRQNKSTVFIDGKEDD